MDGDACALFFGQIVEDRSDSDIDFLLEWAPYRDDSDTK